MNPLIFLFLLLCIWTDGLFAKEKNLHKGIVLATHKIDLHPYKDAFNPSLCEVENGYLLTFRYLPSPVKAPWVSYIGTALLNRSFELVSPPHLLDLRQGDTFTPSQAEDARVFTYKGGVYIIYNDNRWTVNTRPCDRREMFLAKLIYDNGRFTASPPLRLVHATNYSTRLWEKNWTPFVFNDTLLLYYTINPSEVLAVDWKTGVCSPVHKGFSFVENWRLGQLRGGTPALSEGEEYLAFFHSMTNTSSRSSGANSIYYYMGAYTFSAAPPFLVTKMSSLPINHKSFYAPPVGLKKVIYPGGYVTFQNHIYVAYGRDDCEVWIADIDKNLLMRSLKKVR